MKRVLIVMTSQFGYHTDTLMYCKYINKKKFDVHYLGFDIGKKRIELSDITVHYVPYGGGRVNSYFRFLKKCIELQNLSLDLVFHVHTRLSLLIRLLFWNQNYVFDIRTGDLSNNRFLRCCKNANITFMSYLSRNVSVVSEGLAKKLSLRQNTMHILPLGGEILPIAEKTFEKLKLIYIGTLTKRNIHQTIVGLSLFKQKYGVKFSYDIFGSGSQYELNRITQLIKQYALTSIIRLRGYVDHSKLAIYLEQSNVGVVYIPCEPYYQIQPSTKLYECLLAGMPVIATKTEENMKELATRPKLGVFCDDNPESFCEALHILWQKKTTFDSKEIKESMIHRDWQNIVKENLEPYWLKLINT